MNGKKALRPVQLLATALPLALLLLAGHPLLPVEQTGVTAPSDLAALPPAAVQGLSFSVATGGAATETGVHPADILGIGGAPLISCENLGLLCYGASDNVDDIASLSFGDDFGDDDLPSLQFSVDGAARGRAGSAVQSEADCTPAEAQADAFQTALDGHNSQTLDGDGAACANGEGYGLSLAEDSAADMIDALARDPCLTVDLNCDGTPDAPIYLTLAPGSPTLDLIGATAADILVTGYEYTSIVWAAGIETLGLAAGDAIDGLCLSEDGDGVYGEGDVVVISLAPGSPTLAQLGAEPGDLLGIAPLRKIASASALGLERADNVDALICANAIPQATTGELYLPLIQQQ